MVGYDGGFNLGPVLERFVEFHMAGRFSNLEFDNSHGEQQESTVETPSSERDAWQILEHARIAHWDGQFETALRLYTRALREDRKLIRAWVGQVQMLVDLREYREARIWSDKALELFRNNGELLAAKAQACIRLKDKASALACSDGAIQAAGTSPWRWEVRGEVLLARGDRQFDLCFQKALEDLAADWFDRVMISRIYRFYGRYASAMNYLQQAIELAPTKAYSWFEIGECQRSLGLIGVAQTSYKRCLELRPDCREADDALGAIDSVSFSDWVRSLFSRWSGR